MSIRLAVFASGGGSNLQSIIDHFTRHPARPVVVALVVSDRATAGALQRAAAAGVPTAVIPVTDVEQATVTDEMLRMLHASSIDVVALAGYTRLVPAAVVRAYAGRIVNIHPALLPAFGGPGMYGRRVHRAVLAAGCTVSGATVHFVDEEYDTGRVIAQWPVPVLPDDDDDRLAARVLAVEHRLYPAALEWLADALRAGESAPTLPIPELHFALAADALPAGVTVRSMIRRRED